MSGNGRGVPRRRGGAEERVVRQYRPRGRSGADDPAAMTRRGAIILRPPVAGATRTVYARGRGRNNAPDARRTPRIMELPRLRR